MFTVFIAMTRKEIKEFIRLGVVAITPALEFDSGLLTDFNSERSNIYPKVWLESLEVDTVVPVSAPVDTWPIKLYIAGKDQMDSKPSQYEDLIDKADFIAQKLIYQYRNVVKGFKLVEILGEKREPWIKKNADCLTGVVLSFDLKATDATDVCVDD